MFRKSLFTAVIVLSLGFVPSMVQSECGDVNQSGDVTVGDLAAIIDHVVNGIVWPAWDLAAGDLDDRVGVTVSDAVLLSRYLFVGTFPLNCTPTQTYSYTHVETDTVWMSQMKDIPDGINRVVLPLRLSLQSNTNGLTIGAINLQALGFEKFTLTAITGTGPYPDPITFGVILGDTTAIVMAETEPGSLDGITELLNLEYERVAPGIGAAGGFYIDVPGHRLRTLIEKDGDLLEPRYMIVDYDVPVDTLYANSPSLDFTADVATLSPITVDLEITSAFGDITFDLAASEDWIVLPPTPIGGWIAPVTIPVTADAAELLAGSYAGNLTVTVLDPLDAVNTIPTLPVTFAVILPNLFSPGDANCDGKVSISDISRIIDLLFLTGTPLEPCE